MKTLDKNMTLYVNSDNNMTLYVNSDIMDVDDILKLI